MTSTQDRICEFCTKAFKRSDVLRRHYKRCPFRLGRPIPERLQAGRRAKACDQCASLKIACDADYPCESCLSRGYVCSVNGLHRQSQYARPVRESGGASAPQDQNVSQPSNQQNRFAFLLNYMNPATSSLESAFRIQPLSEQQQIQCIRQGFLRSCERLTSVRPQVLKSQKVIYDFDFDPSANHLLMDDDVTEDLREEQDRILSERLSYENSTTTWSNILQDIPRSLQISLDYLGRGLIDELIHYTSKINMREMITAPNLNIRAACSLLSGGAIPAFITNYFVQWNPHSPIVHRPSFRVAQVTPPLLLAILVTGGLLSSDAKVVLQAKMMLGLAEQYVFDHEDFQYLLEYPKLGFAPFKPQYLSSIQATLTILQAQLRYAPQDKKAGILHSRFNQLVNATQTLGLHQRRHSHKPLSPSPDKFEWNEFSIDEAGSRVMCGIYNLDASFSIFYDVAPRLIFTNMALDVPCTATAYMARDREECFHSISQQNAIAKMRVSEMLDVLYQENDAVINHVKDFNVLHLFILILAILQSMWLLEQDQLQGRTKITVVRGLRRWKAAWDYQIAIQSQSSLEMYGFSKSVAIELWHLANFMVDKGFTRISYVSRTLVNDLESSSDPVSRCYNTLKQISDSY